ncbi:hypothetical protein [uncultured Sphingomonas sp.]|uniref:hypothetical protein n=1 Tax=uncultured Sphingomonas sp. TaxID=158754 RepID=UPI0035CC3B2C
MQSLAGSLGRRSGEVPGRAPIHVLLVAVIVALQGIEVSDSSSLLNTRLVWAAYPVCIGTLAASLGFALAQGHAVAGWRAFATDRLRRTAPVHAAAVLLAAFAIGPLVTNLGMRSYFSDPQTYAYLLNLVAWPRFTLPGVFEFNNLSGIVNRNVWVAPIGLVLLVAACVGPDRRITKHAPIALAAVVGLAAVTLEMSGVSSGDSSGPAAQFLRGDALSALLGGLIGIAAFRVRARVPSDRRLAAGAIAVVGALAFFGNASWAASAWFRVICAPPIAYAALYLSMRRLPGALAAPRLEPYLTGVFLFSFPLQQLLIEEGPVRQNVFLNIAVGGSLALALALMLRRVVGWVLLGERRRGTAPVAAAGEGRPLPPRRRNGHVPLGPALAYFAVAAILILVCLGLMAMLYLAFQSDPGGI